MIHISSYYLTTCDITYPLMCTLWYHYWQWGLSSNGSISCCQTWSKVCHSWARTGWELRFGRSEIWDLRSQIWQIHQNRIISDYLLWHDVTKPDLCRFVAKSRMPNYCMFWSSGSILCSERCFRLWTSPYLIKPFSESRSEMCTSVKTLEIPT